MVRKVKEGYGAVYKEQQNDMSTRNVQISGVDFQSQRQW